MSGNTPVPQPGVPSPGPGENAAQHTVAMPVAPGTDAAHTSREIPPPVPVRYSSAATSPALPRPPQGPPPPQPVYRTPPDRKSVV